MGNSNIKMEKFTTHNYLTSQNDFKKVYIQLKNYMDFEEHN